ncbi:MAG: hypothetical protein IKS35_00910 [Clostridia bacterium]|nr:hypothetical protein [Clostridia bacterium]
MRKIALWKNIVSLVVILSMFNFLLLACQSKPRDETLETTPAEQHVSIISTPMESQCDFSDLPEYSYVRLMSNLSWKKPSSAPKIMPSSSSKMNSMDSFNALFPIKKGYYVNSDCICVEYKIKKQDSVLHAFVVFDVSTHNDSSYTYESYPFWGELYFAYPQLESDMVLSYNHSKCTLDSLPFLIDPSTTLFFGNAENQTPNTRHSEETILLKDGYMIIDYYVTGADSNELDITGMVFIPYGENNTNYPDNSLVKFAFIPTF